MIYVGNQKVAMLTSGQCFINRFKNKLIFFKKDKKVEPTIIFELTGHIDLEDDIKKWIRKRNHSVIFKSTLNCDYSN